MPKLTSVKLISLRSNSMPELQLTAIARYEMNTSFGGLSFQGEVSYADNFYTSISKFDF